MSGALRSLVPAFVRRSYVLKFGITLLVFGLTVGTVGFVATDQIEHRVTDGVERDLAAIAGQEAETFETWHESNVGTVTALADGVTDRPTADEQSSYLTRRSSDVERLGPAYLVDLDDDRVVAGTDSQGRPLDAVGTAWATALAGTDGGIDEPRVVATSGGGESDEPPRLVYAAPVGDGDGGRVVVAAVRVGSYESGLGDDSTFVLVVDNRDLTVLYDSTGAATFRQYQIEGRPNAVLTAAQERDGLAVDDGVVEPNVGDRVTLEGTAFAGSAAAVGASEERLLTSWGHVDGAPYTVVVFTPESAAVGFVQTVERLGFVVSIVGVIVVALFGLLVGYSTASDIDRLRLKSEEMEQGNLDVDLETDRLDNIGRLYDSMANMRDALRGQIVEARTASEEAENARKRAEQTNRHLQAKANEYRDVMQAVAAGDLGRRMTPSGRNQAMREIAEDFNSMIEEMERTVARLKSFADEVAESSEEVTASAEEVRSASEQVTASMRQISEEAERQNDSLQSVAREMDDLSTTVEEIAVLSNEVADISERTAEAGRRGRDAARQAIDGMNQIEEDSADAVEAIERLDDEMDQVDDLVDAIADLADQTNMIALNANIEASRADGEGAGESGGFAVVAQEVKDLASETKRAADSIDQRITEIQATTDETVASVTATGERIADNTESVRNAVEALDEVAEYAEETNGGVQEISAATEEQAASTEEAVGMVDEAASISERTSAEAQNVAAAAEEQTTAVSAVTDAASGLSAQASRLSDGLGRFRTSETGSDLFERDGPSETADGTPDGDDDGDRE